MPEIFDVLRVDLYMIISIIRMNISATGTPTATPRLTSSSITIASSGTIVTAALVEELVVFVAGVIAVGVITIGEAVEVTGKLVGGTLGDEVIGELVVEVDGKRLGIPLGNVVLGATVGVDEIGALVGNELVGEMVGELLGAIVGLDVVGEIVGGKVYGFLSASKVEPFTAMVTSVPLTVNSKL